MAIDEAELEPRELAEKLHAQQIMQEKVNRHLPHYSCWNIRVIYCFVHQADNYTVWVIAPATEHASWNEEI
jgi:hypothetical protein